MFIVKTYRVPADRVIDAYTSRWEFETQQDAMCCVGEYLGRGHVVVVERPATGLFPAGKVCYTLDTKADAVADELIDAWCDAIEERDRCADYGC